MNIIVDSCFDLRSLHAVMLYKVKPLQHPAGIVNKAMLLCS